ncbi:hypothetical protein BJ165DRAFT_1533913 [Panaeolus papilionaceus]|nr:hypothetical protein BJ165DRAFT_1533913 [Panaeolus papilionaceus]
MGDQHIPRFFPLHSPPPSPLLHAPDNTPTGSPSFALHLPSMQEFPWAVLAGVSNLIHLANAQTREDGLDNPWGSSAWDRSPSPLGLIDEEWEQHRWFHDNIGEPALGGCLDEDGLGEDANLNSPASSALSTSTDETASFCALSPSPPSRTSLARTRIRKRKARATSGILYVDDSDDDNDRRDSDDVEEDEGRKAGQVEDEEAGGEHEETGGEGESDEEGVGKGEGGNDVELEADSDIAIGPSTLSQKRRARSPDLEALPVSRRCRFT